MIRRLKFASVYVYWPRGHGAAAEHSRALCAAVKSAEARILDLCARRVRDELSGGSRFAGFVRPDDVWVPVPGCGMSRGSRPPLSQRLAAALLGEGLGGAIWPGLHRLRAVPKSATARCRLRPTVAHHYASLGVGEGAAPPARLVLVDDVISRGRTLLAAANRLHDTFPTHEIEGFALMRTIGGDGERPELVDPCVGVVRWRAGDAYRTP